MTLQEQLAQAEADWRKSYTEIARIRAAIELQGE